MTAERRARDGEYPVALNELITSPRSVYQRNTVFSSRAVLRPCSQCARHGVLCEWCPVSSCGEWCGLCHSAAEVLDVLGRGTFGQVLKCWRRDTNEVVALKVLKNIPSYTKQGQLEIDILSRLSSVSAHDFNIVQAYESFTHHGHICISFELLQTNLYDYLKQNRFQPLPLKHIRPIAQQVLACLEKLQELGLVHSDIKPENVMLVDQGRWPFRVKVIDFGSGTPRSESNATSYLQSRYYRAPEVILSLPYNEAIDMWSLGCVLAELYLGWPLFPGANEYDQISFICSTLGNPPHSMLRNIRKACKFFIFNHRTSQWLLKAPQQVKAEAGIVSKETRKYIFTSLSDLTRVGSHSNQDSPLTYQLDCLQFVALLTTMLTFDPNARTTPTQALQSPFITMQHLAMHTSTSSVREWIQCMHVCCLSRTTNSSPVTHSTPHHPPIPPPTLPAYQYPLPHTLTYHLAPSTLAYLPQHSTPHSLGQKCPHTHTTGTAPDVDTGYVSADSSPASRTNMDGQDAPVFFPVDHTQYRYLQQLPLPLTVPALATPHELYTLYLSQQTALAPSTTITTPLPHYHTLTSTLHPFTPHHPFSRL